MKTIKVTIESDGTFNMKAEGFKGAACTETMGKMLKEVKADVLSKKPTEEYYHERGSSREEDRR